MRCKLLCTLLFAFGISFVASVSVSAQDVETPKTRYYLGTNLMNLPIMGANVDFLVRFPNNFGLHTSVFAWTPWLLNLGIGVLGWWRQNYLGSTLSVPSIPSLQGGVSLIWELGCEPVPPAEKRQKHRRRSER